MYTSLPGTGETPISPYDLRPNALGVHWPSDDDQDDSGLWLYTETCKEWERLGTLLGQIHYEGNPLRRNRKPPTKGLLQALSVPEVFTPCPEPLDGSTGPSGGVLPAEMGFAPSLRGDYRSGDP